MGFDAWLRRSIGRTLRRAKTHLIESSMILGFDSEVVTQMRKADDEQCEALFVKQLEKRCGRAVDWRARPTEVIDAISRFLDSTERARIDALRLDATNHISEVVSEIDASLASDRVRIRALDAFGDSVFVVVVPKEQLPEFDEVNKHWLV